MSFTVAIVGRPNVGKSTLFNRLVGKRLALVDDRPGVTRDRREGSAALGDLAFTLIDTAGLEEAAPDSLTGRMQAQTATALAAADAIFFLIDARIGPTPVDNAFAEMVRRSGKPAILIANKCEGRAAQAGALEAYELGLGEPIAISAEHGEGSERSLRCAACRASRANCRACGGEAAARSSPTTATIDPTRPIHVAVVGRPNSGKSTLINRLIGEERLLTGPEAGITRDAIAVDLEWHGRRFRIHDTAGMRRKSRIEEKLEKLVGRRCAQCDALRRSGDRADGCRDAVRCPGFAHRRSGRARRTRARDRHEQVGSGREPARRVQKLREEADHWLPQVHGVPIVALSGLTGAGLDRMMQAVVDSHAVWNRRVSTSALNRWLPEIIAAHPPPAVSGRRIRLDYITQAKSRPPSFVLFTSRAEAVPDAYRRYLVNALRESFDLPGTPIRLTLREKKNPYASRKTRQR